MHIVHRQTSDVNWWDLAFTSTKALWVVQMSKRFVNKDVHNGYQVSGPV